MKQLNSEQLQNIIGGNRWTNAYSAALGCAVPGVKYGKKLGGVWGAVIGGVGGAAVCAWRVMFVKANLSN